MWYFMFYLIICIFDICVFYFVLFVYLCNIVKGFKLCVKVLNDN